MAYYTNCPECGKSNVKGHRYASLSKALAIGGAGIGAACGGGVLSVPGAAVGGAIGAGVGKILSLGSKKKYEFECPRCGCYWKEEV